MLGLIFLIFLTVTSLIFSILAFLGKDIILDDTYLKASEEEKITMNKKAYRIQAAIVFLFIAVISACNALRALFHIPLFTYLAGALAIVGIIYAIVSHYKIKKKYHTTEGLTVSVKPSVLE